MDAIKAWPWQRLVNNVATSNDIMKQAFCTHTGANHPGHCRPGAGDSDTRKQVHLLMVMVKMMI